MSEADLFGSDEEDSGDDGVGAAFRAGNTSSSNDEEEEMKMDVDKRGGYDSDDKQNEYDDDDKHDEYDNDDKQDDYDAGDGLTTSQQSEQQDDSDEEAHQNSVNEEAQSDSDDEDSDNEKTHQESDNEANQQDTDNDEENIHFGSDSEEEINSQSKSKEEAKPNKSSRMISDFDDSDEDRKGEDKEAVGNLFGDADDISDSDEEQQQKNQDDDDEKKGDEVAPRNTISSDEEEENDEKQQQAEQQEMTRIEVEIPKISTNLGSKIHFVRFPNFLSVENRPFDKNLYEDEIEEDELLDEEGRTRLKLKVENTIRWRKFVDENGIELTESNARIVKWSDGSMSMHLGSEIFDVYQMALQGDHNHLFIRQGTGLQGQAVFKTKLSFRPHSTKSATHKKMTSRLAMRHSQNQQKVRVLPIAGQDPESRKGEMMKKEEEELKAHMRREAQQRRIREKAHQRGLYNNYVDEDDHGVSVSAIKNKHKSRFTDRHRPTMTSSDSDSDHRHNMTSSKTSKNLDSDDSSSSDDDGVEAKRRKTDESHRGGEVRKKAKFVVSDDEEDEDSDRPAAAAVEADSSDNSDEEEKSPPVEKRKTTPQEDEEEEVSSSDVTDSDASD